MIRVCVLIRERDLDEQYHGFYQELDIQLPPMGSILNLEVGKDNATEDFVVTNIPPKWIQKIDRWIVIFERKTNPKLIELCKKNWNEFFIWWTVENP